MRKIGEMILTNAVEQELNTMNKRLATLNDTVEWLKMQSIDHNAAEFISAEREALCSKKRAIMASIKEQAKKEFPDGSKAVLSKHKKEVEIYV